MDVRERYQQAQEAAREGRHEEALGEYLWFHEHALEHEPAMYGVRLSFALAAWIELGQIYPKALAALKEIRDRKTMQLASGGGDRELFHDVDSINEYLEDEKGTYELFLKLQSTSPALAQECAGLAIPALVKAKDFRLARTFIDDPAAKIQKWSTVLNEDIADLAKEPPRDAPVQEAYVHIYAERVGLLLAVLNGVGEREQAESFKEIALASVESTPVREAVATVLSNVTEA
jgi:hypothetical protein